MECKQGEKYSKDGWIDLIHQQVERKLSKYFTYMMWDTNFIMEDRLNWRFYSKHAGMVTQEKRTSRHNKENNDHEN